METTTKQGYKYFCKAIKWFDKVNGNTYHSVRITDLENKEVIVHAFTYRYGDSYRQTALEIMQKSGWLPAEYDGKNTYMYERENNYPILWDVTEGLKRDCVANGEI